MQSPICETSQNCGDTVPLCVDLDGTLIQTDILTEQLLSLLNSPGIIAALTNLSTGSGTNLKCRMDNLAQLDPALLPYNEQFVAFLRSEKTNGRFLVLATAANDACARKVANHLSIFDDIITLNGIHDPTGNEKASALKERFGENGYDYAGNDAADIPAWASARRALLVNASPSVRAALERRDNIAADFPRTSSTTRSMLRAMRPHQWVKNVLIFVPLVTAHAFTEANSLLSAVPAFIAFCAMASAIYIINDLTDIVADRQHPQKRTRPFAKGDLRATTGLMLALVCAIVAAALANLGGTLPILIGYTIASILYSFVLKEYPLVDIFMLAGLYSMRIIAGGIATGHFASLWLIAFSGFFFLSLALVKRTEELQSLAACGCARSPTRRGYRVDDIGILQQFGIASSFAAAVVLALFVSSNTAMAQYRHQEFLWGIVPLILFWECRIWLATSRGKMHHDPIVFAVGDKVSWAVVIGLVLLLSISS